VSDLIDIFLRDTPNFIHRMQSAVGQADADALRESAHSLKGTASNLGARRLAAACGELEKLARDGKSTEAGGLVSRVRDEYGRVCLVLEQEKRR
jgi:HPt (histidine-containing phosphotransfer) domain-containing protein